MENFRYVTCLAYFDTFFQQEEVQLLFSDQPGIGYVEIPLVVTEEQGLVLEEVNGNLRVRSGRGDEVGEDYFWTWEEVLEERQEWWNAGRN